MSTFIAFWKKEWMELLRSGKFIIVLLIFALFGIMNPAIAKLTPWLMETMADSLQDTGLQVTTVTVDATTSWIQLYKNMPMALIVVVLLFGSMFTQEYQRGTLVLVLTKGYPRRNVYLVKTWMALFIWTICFWLSFLITWFYNSYYWDNGNTSNILPAAALFWLFGIWVLLLLVFFSTVFSETSGVLAGTGAIVLLSYVVTIFPNVQDFLPVKLLGAQGLLLESQVIGDYGQAVFVTVVVSAAAAIAGMLLFEKKRI